MAINEYTVLTPDLRQQFLEKGYVKIENAVPLENIKRFSEDVWIRLGYDPQDKSTWEKEKVHMPRHREVIMKVFAPKAWAAICEILGGEDRIDPTLFESFGDSLICNFGSPEWEDVRELPLNPTNPMVQYRLFIYRKKPSLLVCWGTGTCESVLYFYSIEVASGYSILFAPTYHRTETAIGEQAVTVIVLFNDIEPRAGGTFLAPDGLKNVVKWLYEHPEGADSFPVDETGARTCTGKAGDVVIFHPLMVLQSSLVKCRILLIFAIYIYLQPHSASKNYKRIPRFITNPPVTLKGPLNLARENPDDYSLTELVILRALGENGIDAAKMKDWKITGKRRRFTPRTRGGKDAMIIAEVARMKQYALRSGGAIKVDSMHINGPVPYQTVIPTEG
ncbi:hypothetical protein EW145_g2487 [Phellinidium pouzarii]|uniref:Uncharacterized protein n=1 Tax=Phellinidium pouzarii TaxID=167371 RepID=A0A4V3XD81_9AGAM|nr:hypothetical protein EW145_g2487 [Phellinidium pouzarii]